jgi:hypothetical protein
MAKVATSPFALARLHPTLITHPCLTLQLVKSNGKPRPSPAKINIPDSDQLIADMGGRAGIAEPGSDACGLGKDVVTAGPTPSARFRELALQGSVSITCGVYDRHKVVCRPVGSYGSMTIERDARFSVKNGHPVIMCEVSW